MNQIKKDKNKEEVLYDRAIETFKRNVPAHVEIEKLEVEPRLEHGLRPDYLLRVKVYGQEKHYYAEIKTAITENNRLLLQRYQDELKHPVLLIAQYVNPIMAEQLKQDGIEFIDIAGNAFINNLPVYIFIKGNRLQHVAKLTLIKGAFRATGLKMIYAFLCNPGLENKTYREIATTTDVALGTVNKIMEELEDLGFLLDMGKRGKKLIKKENLLQRWITAYPEQLKPKLFMGRYRGREDGWWNPKTLDHLKAQWGGEIAAARLTGYLQPEIITIYIAHEHWAETLLDNKLGIDPKGNVEILKRFWKQDENWQYKELVHPILIYADLIATGNQRNIETAKMIYEQHIVRLIRED